MKTQLIDGYLYSTDTTDMFGQEMLPLKDFFLQLDGGDNIPIIRQLVDKFVPINLMFKIWDDQKFYPKLREKDIENYSGYVQITWTDNPHILEILNSQ